MRIIRDLAACPTSCKGTILALGNFDGLHLGHQAILSHCLDFAKTENRLPAAMTFEPHPREFFSPERGPLRLYPLSRKLKLLEASGIKVLFLVRFNKRFAATSAEEFIHGILHQSIAVTHVVTGYDFAFGKGRQGTTEALAEAGHRLGFGFTGLTPITDEQGTVISSSAIRDALGKGDTATASRMLGRAYDVEGRVMQGERRGQDLGFPTANLSLAGLYKPRFGVYAARMEFENGTWHDAIANVGIKPTFGGKQPLLEVHGFGLKHDFYGEKIRVQLLDYIREEQKFPDMGALKSQIEKDCLTAQSLLSKRKIA